MATAAFAPSWLTDAPRTDGYCRRRPEEGVLYQIVSAHWPDFRRQAEEAGGLPRGIEAFGHHLARPRAAAGVAALAGLMVHGMVDTVFFRLAIQLPFWLPMAILAGMSRLDARSGAAG